MPPASVKLSALVYQAYGLTHDEIALVEWQDRRRTLQSNAVSLEQKSEVHITNLDSAIAIISQIGVMCKEPGCNAKKKLLRQMFSRIVVDVEGLVAEVDLLPPFSYLRKVTERKFLEEKQKASTIADPCSNIVPSTYLEGFEPPTYCSVDNRSNPLSYRYLSTM